MGAHASLYIYIMKLFKKVFSSSNLQSLGKEEKAPKKADEGFCELNSDFRCSYKFDSIIVKLEDRGVRKDSWSDVLGFRANQRAV